MERGAAEPEGRALRPERLRLEVDVRERIVAPVERGGRLAPQDLPRREVLVEELPAALPRDPECLVLRSMPADGRLDDEPALREEIERGELLREEKWVTKWSDDRARGEPDPSSRGRDRAQEHDRARPGRPRVLVSDERVVARILRETFS